MRRLFLAFAALIGLALGACTSPGGSMSPGTTGAPATGVTLAQTARDQSTVPGTSTGGAGTINYNFASQVEPTVAMRLLELAETGGWSAADIKAALGALAGAPQDVRIDGDVDNRGGNSENLGAGSSGAGAASGGSVGR